MAANTVILERDGVVNYDAEPMIASADDWQAIPGSLQALARLSQHGYRVVLTINQPELGQRRLDVEDFISINQRMLTHLAQYGGVIEAIFFCACPPDDDTCDCLKPGPGLLKDIARRLRIGLANVHCVGDKLIDLEAAKKAGARPTLVRTGRGAELVSAGAVPAGVPVYDNLAAFVDALLGRG